MRHSGRLLAAAAALMLGLTGCTGGSFSGYVEASCSPTVDGVTTCVSTQKPVPTVTATVTETPAPAPTVTVTQTVTASPAPATPTPTPTQAPLAATCAPAPANPAKVPVLSAGSDHREWMHGLEMVKHDGKDMVVFSSNNYAPTNPGGGEWVHNIFYSYFDACAPASTFAAKTLVNAPQAQEPASAAVNSAGRLMVTAEDAQFNDWLDQTYGVWDNALGVVKSYGQKLMPPQGGHSGHVAASGDKFLVSFSDGWVDGGGVDNMGTGDDVFAKIVDSNGNAGPMINTAVGTKRVWWPIVAGSDTNWLQVWQELGTTTNNGLVKGSIIDHAGNVVKANFTLFSNVKLYHYDVQWIPATQRYLVTGSQSDGAAVVVLFDKAGNYIDSKSGIYAGTIREAQTVVSEDGLTAIFPSSVGATVLDLTANSVALRKHVTLDWNWDYMGTDGVFAAPNRVVFGTGTQQGVKFLNVAF